MMGISARRDVRLDAPLLTGYQGRRARISGIECRGLRHANGRGNGSEGGFGFLRVIGMIREGPSDDEQTLLIHGHLRVVILLKSGIRRVFHDARLRVGEVVLVTVAGSWHRRGRRPATPSSPGRPLSPRPLPHPCLLPPPLPRPPLARTRFPPR